MEIKKFIENYREAFGEYAELPIVFWYSDILENETVKVNGCFFKSMSKVREGNTISLNAETIGCGGASGGIGIRDSSSSVGGGTGGFGSRRPV